MKLFNDFFAPGVTLKTENPHLVATLPDGRRLLIPMNDLRYQNPNSVPMPEIVVPNMPEWLKPRRGEGDQ